MQYFVPPAIFFYCYKLKPLCSCSIGYRLYISVIDGEVKFPALGEDVSLQKADRYLSTKPKPKMKPIKLKTPPEQIQTITRVMFDIVKKTVLSPLPKLGERVKCVYLLN
ncbi:uncharacterized protein LOC127902117 [Citrus sinensis]|uniref:uncharacterized protein LOC127902117 n=1 Tax=Citrus sinensis TaxID=2711 RepID=UPI00227872F7|nr:uncharacterized protein LOC127902117 [Citrus sinensis]